MSGAVGFINPLGAADNHDILYPVKYVLIVDLDRPVEYLGAKVEQEILSRMHDESFPIISQGNSIRRDSLGSRFYPGDRLGWLDDNRRTIAQLGRRVD